MLGGAGIFLFLPLLAHFIYSLAL